MGTTNDNGSRRPMQGLDGPTLRAVRESIGVPLRRIARKAGMSHGHLSKVERGEHGRPVTPAILSAYERVTGVTLSEAAEQVAKTRDQTTGRRGRTWTLGEMTDMRRRGYNAGIGSLLSDGPLGEPVGRLIDSTGRPITPAPPDEVDLVQLEQAGEQLVGLDMRYGGGLVSQLGKAVLRWAVPMLDAYQLDDPLRARLYRAVGVIAHRVAWAAFDTGSHEAARALFRLALYCAATGEDHDLRGHVLADVAAQHNQVGYPKDALKIIRLGEGDERISPAVRMIMYGAKARTYAATGEVGLCRKQVQAAEAAFGLADPGAPGWVGRLADPARLGALSGHALADLATRTGDAADRGDAAERLEQAIDGFDPQVHARARALCVARLGLLHATSDDPDRSGHWAASIREQLPPGPQIQSGRLGVAIQSVQTDQETDEPGPLGSTDAEKG